MCVRGGGGSSQEEGHQGPADAAGQQGVPSYPPALAFSQFLSIDEAKMPVRAPVRTSVRQEMPAKLSLMVPFIIFGVCLFSVYQGVRAAAFELRVFADFWAV